MGYVKAQRPRERPSRLAADDVIVALSGPEEGRGRPRRRVGPPRPSAAARPPRGPRCVRDTGCPARRGSRRSPSAQGVGGLSRHRGLAVLERGQQVRLHDLERRGPAREPATAHARTSWSGLAKARLSSVTDSALPARPRLSSASSRSVFLGRCGRGGVCPGPSNSDSAYRARERGESIVTKLLAGSTRP